MIKFDILNRFSGSVQFTAEIDCDKNTEKSIKIGLAVKWALKAGANLAGANLADANLAGANLVDANLAGANLARANLARANLVDANLAGANLADANLAGANLVDANLAGANLARANLARANLAGAYLAGAYLKGACLAGAYLTRANLADANLARANLAGANLAGANQISSRIIDGGLRSDGYRFLLTRTEPGAWRIKAGCRNFTVDDGLKHWSDTRPKGESLGDETRLIVAHMLALAKLRAWPETGEEPKTEAA
jgi:hypothetical protein